MEVKRNEERSEAGKEERREGGKEGRKYGGREEILIVNLQFIHSINAEQGATFKSLMDF